jgi:hypothetical protein
VYLLPGTWLDTLQMQIAACNLVAWDDRARRALRRHVDQVRGMELGRQ